MEQTRKEAQERDGIERMSDEAMERLLADVLAVEGGRGEMILKVCIVILYAVTVLSLVVVILYGHFTSKTPTDEATPEVEYVTEDCITFGTNGGGISICDKCSPTLDNGQILICQGHEPTFNDLLDAIEWVESRGNPNAAGDYKSVYKVTPCKVRQPIDPSIYTPLAVGANTMEAQAIGAYQIHKIYVDDVNRMLKILRLENENDWSGYPQEFTYADRWDKYRSHLMVDLYTRWYYRKAAIKNLYNSDLDRRFEAMARIHNGGPDGWKKESTKPYWIKVKAYMERK